MNCRQSALLLVMAWSGCLPLQAAGQTPEASVVDDALAVLQQTMMLPAERIPMKLLNDARGIAIIPNVLKGGFVVGVRHGRGVMAVRDNAGVWQPPAFVSITGGSVGWQAGLQATDLILVFRTHKSIDSLLQNKLTLGVDVAAAAGPVGRTAAASTDLMLRAEILSYSRSRGLFAGVSLDGSSLQIDPAAGQAYYGGTGMTPLGAAGSVTATVPPSAARLLAQLAAYTDGDPNNDQPVPATHLASAAVPAEPTFDQLRQQLAGAVAQLNGLLDSQWKQYLAVPAEMTTLPTPATMSVVTPVLRRYDTVATDARFAALAQRPEFATVHRLVRDYATVAAKQESPKLALPPPPTDPAARP